MKKLNKNSEVFENSLVAYSVVCDSCSVCTCVCSCVPDPVNQNLTNYVKVFASPSTTKSALNNASRGMNGNP